jgi:hypothetical protein
LFPKLNNFPDPCQFIKNTCLVVRLSLYSGLSNSEVRPPRANYGE